MWTHSFALQSTWHKVPCQALRHFQINHHQFKGASLTCTCRNALKNERENRIQYLAHYCQHCVLQGVQELHCSSLVFFSHKLHEASSEILTFELSNTYKNTLTYWNFEWSLQLHGSRSYHQLGKLSAHCALLHWSCQLVLVWPSPLSKVTELDLR